MCMKICHCRQKWSVNRVRSFLSLVSSVHGVRRLAALRGARWGAGLALAAATVLLTAAFVVEVRDHYRSDRIVTKINANCKVNMVPFPAVSICNFNVVSLRNSQNIAAILKKHNKSDQEVLEFLRSLPHLLDLSSPAVPLAALQHATDILRRHYYQIDSIMEEVHQGCGGLLVRCSFNRRELACGDVFTLIKTYEGFCCAFNYAALNDASEDSTIPKQQNDFEYYQDAENFESTNIITTSEFGRKSGLSVVLNIEPQDMPEWRMPYQGAKVMISDPNDYPETTVTTRLLVAGESLELKIQPVIFQSEPELQHVAPSARLCWFHKEVFLAHTDRYSYETCNTECKMNSFREICGCLPYKYPRETSTRICDFSDLECLRHVTVHGSMLTCEPTCYAECGDKRYSVASNIAPLPPGAPDLLQQNLTLRDLSALQVFFNKATCNCYHMSLLMDLNYMIATYGGVFSLSFGASLITFFEIVHLMITLTVNYIRQRFIRSQRGGGRVGTTERHNGNTKKSIALNDHE